MTAFLALVRKDLRLYFSNRRPVILSIVAPILIAAFFGSLFGRGDGKPQNIPVAITDLDRSELSTKIFAAMRVAKHAHAKPLDGALPLVHQLRKGFGVVMRPHTPHHLLVRGRQNILEQIHS